MDIMHRGYVKGGGLIALALAVIAGFQPASAQGLPKAGTISWHTGWRYTPDALTVADAHLIGKGSTSGVSFNDRGTGPLHLGPANCFESFEMIGGKGTSRGVCAFGDVDGDRLFTSFTGSFGPDGAQGTNEITGGTGKYAGIQGSGPWKCKGSGSNGEVQCAQRLDYRLP